MTLYKDSNKTFKVSCLIKSSNFNNKDYEINFDHIEIK